MLRIEHDCTRYWGQYLTFPITFTSHIDLISYTNLNRGHNLIYRCEDGTLVDLGKIDRAIVSSTQAIYTTYNHIHVVKPGEVYQKYTIYDLIRWVKENPDGARYM